MPDLDQRLRNDAARTKSAVLPDFADALDVAVSLSGFPSTGRRRWAATAVASAAAILLVGGSVALVRTGAPDSRRPAQTGPSGGSRSAALPLVGAITEPGSDRPRQLMVVARNRAARCSSPSVRIHENRTEVRVRVVQNRIYLGAPGILLPVSIRPIGTEKGTTRPVASLPTSHGPDLCDGIDAGNGYSEVIAQLRQPLGKRRVVDETSGRTVPVLSAPAPSPHYLPSGYRELGPGTGDPMSSVPLARRAGAFFPLAVARFYATSAGDRLEVTGALARSTVPGTQTVDHVRIDGHPAAETVSRSFHCVTWQVTADHGRQVCSVPAAGRVAVDFGELTRVARSLTG